VLREDGANVDEVDPTFQYMIEALHPQNNGLFRLWTRFMLSSYSDEQVIAHLMVLNHIFRLTEWSIR
jgi:hypothetical protein